MTAAAGPQPMATGVMPATRAANYTVSSACATVPGIAQMVPSMTDFLAGLQVPTAALPPP